MLALLLSLSLVALRAQDCTFQKDPSSYRNREQSAWQQSFDATTKSTARLGGGGRAVKASAMPRVSYIDDFVFSKLEERDIPSAAISTDEEFLRRASLDLTGRIPSVADARSFLTSTEPNKRDLLIDKLLASDDFVDKWTMFFGDLLKNNSFPAAFDRQINGRNTYHQWIRQQIIRDRSIKDIARDLVKGTGNTFDAATAAANFPISSLTPGGPVQDSMDAMLSVTTSTFLGLGETDCLLCHNGRGHLDQVNLWGAGRTRLEAWRMAAFFSRLDMPQRSALPESDPYWRSYDVKDKTTGSYDLGTDWGNRPNRVPVGGTRSLTPEYFGGKAPPSTAWRSAFAELMVEDRLFSINFANRLWKEMFTLALVEPVDSLDPARLDPQNPPEAPWTLQATHPELLIASANFLKAYDYNLRGFLRDVVQSTAYQLSSRYSGEWKYEYVNSFARHYPRRLMAEEVHDAIVKATGVTANYNVQGLGQISWAMQLPEPAEPRSSGATATFLNFFLRGNRDSQPRSTGLSILQQMYLMNDTFVTNRTRMTSSPTLQAVAKLSGVGEVVDELYMLFLSRRPTASERALGVEFLGAAKDTTERNTLMEDLAWVLINKPDFVFSF